MIVTPLQQQCSYRVELYHVNFQDSNVCSLWFSALQQKKMHVSLATLNHQESALGRPSSLRRRSMMFTYKCCVIMEATACVAYPAYQNVSYALYKDTSALNHAGRLPVLLPSSHQSALQKESTRLGSRQNLLPSTCNVSPLAAKTDHESLTAKACLYLFMILFKTRVPCPALTNQMLLALLHASDGSATKKCSEKNY